MPPSSLAVEPDGPLEPSELAGAGDAGRRQIRGSSLLLVGRVLALVINMGAQVLMVRYLSKTDFGAVAYALSLVSLGQQVATFGLDRAVTRFLPMFDERREDGKVLGTLILVVGSIAFVGASVVALVYLFGPQLAAGVIRDETSFAVLLVLIMLAPIQALDDVLVGLFAVFAHPRAIFMRRYILGPGLRLAVVIALVTLGAGVTFLAVGYVAAAAVGVAIYSVVLFRQLDRRGMLARMRTAKTEFPIREILAFTLPLLTSDLVYILITASDAIILGYFHDPETVAAYRVVQPAANLNLLVTSSFALLFTPVAARLVARRDDAGVNELYWQTAGWLAVISFPLFALTFALSAPITTTLWGERYEESALYLSILAVGLYFNGVLGFNGLTLKVLGRMRAVLAVNGAAAIATILFNLALIPRFGALGAAIGTAASYGVYNAAKQLALRRSSNVAGFDARYARLYLLISLAVGALVVLRLTIESPLVLGAGVAATSAGVLVAGRRVLDVERTFPELARLPMFGRWLRGT